MEVLSQTYVKGMIVNAGEAYRLRGTVLGPVEVRAGGELINEGCITGQLYVCAGATVHMRGFAASMRWEQRSDVTFHGVKHPSTLSLGDRPDTGPEGWGALNAAWAECVPALEQLVGDVAHREGGTEYAFRAAAATTGLTGRSDATLWALLAAAVFNDEASLQITGVQKRGLWSPHDCRARLPWTELDRYFDVVPEPFAGLLPIMTLAGSRVAFDYYEALCQLIWAVLGIGDPPAPETVARFEAFRTMLRQQSTPGSISANPKPTSGSTVRGGPSNAPKAPAKRWGWATPSASAGSRNVRRDPAIRRHANPGAAALAELDGLIGLANVKEEVRQLCGFANIERQRVLNGEPPTEITHHLVMTGNPGTGKTTVARLLGKIYFGYGLLKRPKVREVTRSNLVAGYVGHTEQKIEKVFHETLGGVLFIDEAYSLASESDQDFGPVAINALVPLMENYRSEIMVIVAGYPEPMRRLLRSNPGFPGRFGQTIHFPDYSDGELMQILRRYCHKGGFDLTEGADGACPAVISKARARMGEQFDNARMVRRMFEAAVRRHHARVDIQPSERRRRTRTELRELTADDIPKAEQLVPDGEDTA